mgnify:CR=1 FL=1
MAEQNLLQLKYFGYPDDPWGDKGVYFIIRDHETSWVDWRDTDMYDILRIDITNICNKLNLKCSLEGYDFDKWRVYE